MIEKRVKEGLKIATMQAIKEVEEKLEESEIDKVTESSKMFYGDLEKIQDITDLIAGLMLSVIISRAKGNNADIAVYPMLKELARREGWE